MFTGLVVNIGHVVAAVKKPSKDIVLRVTTGLDIRNFERGASVCINGICLTIVDMGKAQDAKDWFVFQASSATADVTTVKDWKLGTPVNIEPSLKVGDELGGHIVSGHVDSVSTLKFRERVNESLQLDFTIPEGLEALIAPKGSVTLDGVSLTVNAVHNGMFSVNIIPHTQNLTTLSEIQIGDKVNLEVDPIARYVAHYGNNFFANKII